MRAVSVVLATAVALALQTTLTRLVPDSRVTVDFVLVVVVYAALVAGPVTGLLAGTFAGLVQDALSSGVVGIGGLAKTIVGYAAGTIGTQFIVARPLPRFVVFFAASIAHAVIFIGLHEVLGAREFGLPYAVETTRALGNALIGVAAFQVGDMLPGAIERRRTARMGLRR